MSFGLPPYMMHHTSLILFHFLFPILSLKRVLCNVLGMYFTHMLISYTYGTCSGVHGVICDLPSQTVTVSGIVPFHRLLKKLKHVKRRSKLLGFTSPNSPFSPSYGHQSFGPHYSSSSSFGSSAYNSGTYRPSYREPFSPPHSYGSSYIPEVYERPYYEDYEDYRPYGSY